MISGGLRLQASKRKLSCNIFKPLAQQALGYELNRSVERKCLKRKLIMAYFLMCMIPNCLPSILLQDEAFYF